MTFTQALHKLPDCLFTGIDLVGQHKTIDDLLFMAQTELDLANEGDIELSSRDRRAINKFIQEVKR